MAAQPWTADRIPSQAGRRAIVTGANSGIGFYTALELARAGAEVTLACRTQAKCDEAMGRIRREVASAAVVGEVLDVSELGSVGAFAERQGGRPLDLLIHNAGVMAVPRRELTSDGYERQFATNYLGPFALTGLLLPALLAVPRARVVAVSSGVAKRARIDFDNLQGERSYSPMWGAYAQSKLADLMFALELQRRAAAGGLTLTSTAAHPGFALTNLQRGEMGLAATIAVGLLKPVLSQDAQRGALPTLYAAVAEEAQPGGYYGPDGPLEMKGFPREVAVPRAALEVAVRERLWEVSEKLTGVRFAPA